MNIFLKQYSKSLKWVISILTMVVISTPAYAVIEGISDTTVAGAPVFNLTASEGYITTPDGDSLLIWGYAAAGGVMQYPGPTIIVNQGDVVTVNLTNSLNVTVPLGIKTSMIFPGQQNVTVTGGTAGLITNETSDPLDVVTYTFTATTPGTYMYQSGTSQTTQLEMGLIGTIVVRPTLAATITATQAYGTADTAYDYEYLFVLTEMDPQVHYAIEFANSLAEVEAIDNTEHHPVLWFINGRNGPDTVAPSNAPYLPYQPMGSLVQVHPGDTALIRFVNAGRDLHPFHTHGNHFKMLARDGRLMQSSPAANSVDLAREDFTLQAVPGATYDVLWGWTGEKLGWDILGDVAADPASAHTCDTPNGYDTVTKEYCPDHNKPFPTTRTNQAELSFGGYYSGSPFLGAFANLPPGEGGLNLNGGMFYMWHSHNEREIVNNDIYPGGMLTMMVVEPFNVVIPK